MTTNQITVFGDRMDGTDYRSRQAVYALIFSEDNKIAIIKSGNRYFLPGGGIEEGETQQECLIRECTEEIGYDIEVKEYIGCASQYLVSFKTNEHMHLTGYFYAAQLLRPNYQKIEPDHDLEWLRPEEAINKMYVEFQAWAIQRITDRNI